MEAGVTLLRINEGTAAPCPQRAFCCLRAFAHVPSFCLECVLRRGPTWTTDLVQESSLNPPPKNSPYQLPPIRLALSLRAPVSSWFALTDSVMVYVHHVTPATHTHTHTHTHTPLLSLVLSSPSSSRLRRRQHLAQQHLVQLGCPANIS